MLLYGLDVYAADPSVQFIVLKKSPNCNPPASEVRCTRVYKKKSSSVKSAHTLAGVNVFDFIIYKVSKNEIIVVGATPTVACRPEAHRKGDASQRGSPMIWVR